MNSSRISIQKVLLISLCFLMYFPVSYSQQNEWSEEVKAKINKHIQQVEKDKKNMSQSNKKIESNLLTLVNKMQNDNEKGKLNKNNINYSSTGVTMILLLEPTYISVESVGIMGLMKWQKEYCN